MAVTRYDAGTLQAPRKTAQGFLRVDGHASKCGVLEYRDGSGSVRRELRLPEDVFAPLSLAEFEGAPLTDDHPSSMVGPTNVAGVARGMVVGPGRRDGDLVAISAVVTDPELIAKMESGKRQLSVGYAVDLEETPGRHPEYGSYDAIQRRIIPNHLAVVDLGRAGPAASVRMDAACWVLVESTPDLRDANLMPDSGNSESATRKDTMTPEETTAALAAALKEIAALKAQAAGAAGETEDADKPVEGDAPVAPVEGDAPVAPVEGDAPADPAAPEEGVVEMPDEDNEDSMESGCGEGEGGNEDEENEDTFGEDQPVPGGEKSEGESEDPKKKKIPPFIQKKLEKADAKIAELEGQLANIRKDTAQAKVDVDRMRSTTAASVAAQVAKVRKDAEDDLFGRVKARATLLTKAYAVLGDDAKVKTSTRRDGAAVVEDLALADAPDRAIKCAVVKFIDGEVLGKDRHDAYVDAMFDGALKRHTKGATALGQTRAAIASRADGAAIANDNPEEAAKAALREKYQHAWLTPTK